MLSTVVIASAGDEEEGSGDRRYRDPDFLYCVPVPVLLPGSHAKKSDLFCAGVSPLHFDLQLNL